MSLFYCILLLITRSRAKRSFRSAILTIGEHAYRPNYANASRSLIHDFGYSHLEGNLLLRCCKLRFNNPFSGGCGRIDSMLQTDGLLLERKKKRDGVFFAVDTVARETEIQHPTSPSVRLQGRIQRYRSCGRASPSA